MSIDIKSFLETQRRLLTEEKRRLGLLKDIQAQVKTKDFPFEVPIMCTVMNVEWAWSVTVYSALQRYTDSAVFILRRINIVCRMLLIYDRDWVPINKDKRLTNLNILYFQMKPLQSIYFTLSNQQITLRQWNFRYIIVKCFIPDSLWLCITPTLDGWIIIFIHVNENMPSLSGWVLLCDLVLYWFLPATIKGWNSLSFYVILSLLF